MQPGLNFPSGTSSRSSTTPSARGYCTRFSITSEARRGSLWLTRDQAAMLCTNTRGSNPWASWETRNYLGTFTRRNEFVCWTAATESKPHEQCRARLAWVVAVGTNPIGRAAYFYLNGAFLKNWC